MRTKLSQQASSHKLELDKHRVINEELETQKEVMNQQIGFLKNQLIQKDEQRELQHTEVCNLEEQIKAFERQQEEMEVQIDELTNQLQQKDSELVNLRQNLDFSSSFDFNNTKVVGEDAEPSASMQAMRLHDENEYLASQIQSHLNTIEEQKQQISKYQNVENQSRMELERKTSELRRLALEHEAERKDAEQAHRRELDGTLEAQEQEKQKTAQEIDEARRKLQEKDYEIEGLKNVVAQLQQQFHPGRSSMQHSPIRHNLSVLMASRDFQQTIQGMQASQHNHVQPGKSQQHNNSSLDGEASAGQAAATGVMAYPQSQLHAGLKVVQNISSLDLGNETQNNRTLNLNLSQQFSQLDQNYQVAESQILNNCGQSRSRENQLLVSQPAN